MVAGQEMAFEAFQRLEYLAATELGGTDEDTGHTALEASRIKTGALEGLPGGLQQQPLLRVHRQRLTRGDPEETGVEPGGIGEEAALVGHTGAGSRAPSPGPRASR